MRYVLRVLIDFPWNSPRPPDVSDTNQLQQADIKADEAEVREPLCLDYTLLSIQGPVAAAPRNKKKKTRQRQTDHSY